MTRHELREIVFKKVFQLPFNDGSLPEVDYEDSFEAEAEPTEEEKAYIDAKVSGITENLAAIDETIEKHSKSWKISRIGKTELAILRVAVYEISFDVDVPDKVALNEAIELAKQYGTDKAPAFINGVLSGLVI
ncbi:MAG: transcription antitermination factor NusB [Eubacterium sp.]|nr:transcription antitermination factor NusB [Eubacterium sp.]